MVGVIEESQDNAKILSRHEAHRRISNSLVVSCMSCYRSL